MVDNDVNQILWDQNRRNPFFDLELIEIPKDNFDPSTPIDIINRDLKNLREYFIMGHLNARSLNKNIVELKLS